jgi:hypothetical protein
MFKPLAVIIGATILSLGASDAHAQRHSPGRNPRRAPEIVQPRQQVRHERVWVEDFELVEERYQEEGRFEMRERQVWIEEQHITVHERFLVPEKKVIVTERVLVPEQKILVDKNVRVKGQFVEYNETMHFATGSCFTFRRIKYVPEHDEIRKVEKCIPAHYVERQVEKCIPAHEECREVVKCIPGHFETVCEKVFVPGCIKTRMVKKCIGGHYEIRAVCR